jgi:putative endopeptidase
MKQFILPLALLSFLWSCDASKTVTAEPEQAAEATSISKDKSRTIDLDYLNASIKPQDDFFEFSNGSWLKNNPVPPSESRWGSFNELEQANNKKLTALLEEFKAISGEYEQGTIQQILGDYYASFTNMDVRDKVGIAAINDDLSIVNSLNSKENIPSIIAKMHSIGIGGLFRFGVGQDMKNVESNIASMSQGGIGLPNKDYYLEESKAEILEKYNAHIIAMMVLTGYPEDDAREFANSVVAFETKLAEVMMARAELRVPENTYNKMSRSDAILAAGDFDLEAYLRDCGIESFDSLIVGQPEFLKNLSTLVKDASLSDWRYYLTWQVINNYAGHMDTRFVEQNFDFYGRVLSGKTEMKPINERAIGEITHQEFGELLGKAFVGRHYSDVAKQRVNTMVDNLLIVFEERIQSLEWMDDETKGQALIKLAAIGRKLGYPNKWEDFSALKFNSNDYIGNVRSTAEFSRKKNLAKLYKPVDKEEWGMPAHMINAYYHPLLNEIAFPAGIMQDPFFSEDFEDAVNYGRIGMVIGHEFTHGFDDMGSKFAADGSFTNWWSEADRASFDERTEKLGKTFAGFCPIEDNCVNPALTMGENIADLGGLTLAYYAYTRTDEFKAGGVRKGYTPAQRFFIAYAQLWKINYTDEELKNRIANDPHSPGMFRVNGPLMNCPEFFKAFQVQESDPMRNSAEKISKIW